MAQIERYRNLTRNDLLELVTSMYSTQSPKTLRAFDESMKRIELAYGLPIEQIKLSFLQDPNELVEKLIEKNYSENTICNTLSAVCKICKVCDLPAKYITLVRKYMLGYKQYIDGEKQKNMKSEYEEENWVDWSEIHEKVLLAVPYYLEEEGLSRLEYMRFLLLALFVLQTPRRYGNYMNLDVFKTKMDIEKLSKIENRNFLVIDNGGYTFVFNNYKTYKYLGSQKHKVENPDLVKLLDRWFSEYNKASKYLFVDKYGNESKRTTIIEQMKIITNDLFDKNFSVDILRHSFISNLIKENPTVQDKIRIAYELGQTYKPQQLDLYNRHS